MENNNNKCMNCKYWKPLFPPEDKNKYHTGHCKSEYITKLYPEIMTHNNFSCTDFKQK